VVLLIAGAIIKILSSPIAWLVLVPLAVGIWWLRHQITSRRRAEAIAQHERWLYDQSCLPAADVMSGRQFEQYVAELLRRDGHSDVQPVGGPGDGGADILSTEPSGRRVAVQCKRQLAPVPVGVIRQLNGTLAHEHAGRRGVLVTTARLTRPAAELAAQAGITVVDRDRLAHWMGEARQSLEAGPALALSANPPPPRPAAWPQPDVPPHLLTPGPW
jgi:restriction system protein